MALTPSTSTAAAPGGCVVVVVVGGGSVVVVVGSVEVVVGSVVVVVASVVVVVWLVAWVGAAIATSATAPAIATRQAHRTSTYADFAAASLRSWADGAASRTSMANALVQSRPALL